MAMKVHKRPLQSLAVLAVAGVCALRFAGLGFAAPAASHLRSSAVAQQSGAQQLLAGKTSYDGFRLPAIRNAPAVEDVEEGASMSMVLGATALAAAAAASAPAEEKKKKSLLDTFRLPIYVGLWYFFNVQYNLQNKILLKAFSATWAVSWIQLFAGIPIALLMWGTGAVKKPSVTAADMTKLAPVGLFFALGQVATVASLGAVAVSFTHVVKALEPAVNAIFSALLLGQVFHPMVYASLLPVFAGVAMASSSELSFSMFGFVMAMLSNVAFAARNVMAAKTGGVGQMGEDNVTRKTNQLAVLTFVATAVLLPVALILPGGLRDFGSAWNAAIASGMAPAKLGSLLGLSGFYFFMYQLSSFWVLSQVPPITHSVLNTLKRVVIIVISIIVFRTPVTPMGMAGTATAIFGVLLYSLTKAHYSKKEKAEKLAKEAKAAKKEEE